MASQRRETARKPASSWNTGTQKGRKKAKNDENTPPSGNATPPCKQSRKNTTSQGTTAQENDAAAALMSMGGQTVNDVELDSDHCDSESGCKSNPNYETDNTLEDSDEIEETDDGKHKVVLVHLCHSESPQELDIAVTQITPKIRVP
jgi:hypothetical protein